MKRIAIWNTAFLGDAVLTLPLIQSVKKAYPDAFLDFFVRAGFEPLFTAHPSIGMVHGVHKNGLSFGSAFSIIKKARESKYSLWISAHSSFRSSFIARQTHAELTLGYAESPLANFFYDRTVSREFDKKDEIERLFNLLCPLDIKPSSTWPEIHLPQKARQAAEAFYAKLNLSPDKAPVLGLHPGSVWPSKRWPTEYFAVIGQRALEMGASLLVFAGKGEEALSFEVLQKIKANCPEILHKNIYDLSAGLSLTTLAAYLARLDGYVSNDSGPMHLAWAQKVPVTALFGPTVRKLGFFPRGESSKVFELDLPCRPCGLHGHKSCPKSHHHCMIKLSPDMVWPDVKAKLCARFTSTAL